MILYRSGSRIARLYSIAVAEPWRGRGLSRQLLEVGENGARRRGCHWMQLEVRDDNATARRISREVLEAEGAFVHEAPSVDAGLASLRQAEASGGYDAVILDHLYLSLQKRQQGYGQKESRDI